LIVVIAYPEAPSGEERSEEERGDAAEYQQESREESR
jgi:hypothetical protein